MAVAFKRGSPHTFVDLFHRLSAEPAGVCIPTGNTEMLLAAVCKSPSRLQSDTDITEIGLSWR
jgi:hypothetical protein